MFNIFDRISFFSILVVVALLPAFFLPFTNIPVEISKGLLLVVGLSVAIVFWTMARFFDGKVNVPKSFVLLSGLGIALSFLLSTLFAPTIRTALFGAMFDIGTFWFMLSCTVLMFMSAVIIRNPARARILFFCATVSALSVLIFQVLHLMSPETTSLGILVGKIDNLVGSWNALGIFAGLLGVMSLFSLEFAGISGGIKWLWRFSLLMSIAFAVLTNFHLLWGLLGVFALIIFVFKILSYSRDRQTGGVTAGFPVLPLMVVVASIVFFMSAQSTISSFLPDYLGITNTEVKPSFSSTILIAKETLKKDPVFGAGPNRFGEMWALHKPVSINQTQFWDTYFDFGFGLLPTFAVTTGILGILVWLAFFCSLIVTGLKSVFSTIKDKTNPEAALFFMAALYLFIASFFYPAGTVIIMLAFAFAGAFAGLYAFSNQNGTMSLSFLDDPRKSFFSIIFLVLIMIVAVISSFKFVERFTSVSYFRKTLTTETIPEAEASIAKALALNTNDLYLRTYAQVYLIKLGFQIKENPSPSSEIDAGLQETFDEAVNGALLATTYNHTNYVNFRTLGMVYDSVAPLGVAGAYEKAIESYRMASILNPLNPGLKLSMARAYFASGNPKDAKDFAEQALALKPDYLEALVVLSQISRESGNMSQALSYAEKALKLAPSNKDLIDYINTLR